MKYILTFLLILTFGACKYLGDDKLVYSVSDFINNYGDRDYRLSVSGRYIAFIKANRQSKALYIREITSFGLGKSILVNDTLKESSIKNFRWVGDTSVLYAVKDTSKLCTFRSYNVLKKMTQTIGKVRQNFTFLPVTKDQNHVYMTVSMRDSIYADVYDLNLSNHKLSLHCKNFGNVSKWFLNDEGEVYAAATISKTYREFWFKDSLENKFNKEFKYDLDGFFIPFPYKSNRNIVYGFQNVFSDKSSVITYDINRHKVINTVFANKDFDVSYVRFSFIQNKIETIVYDCFYQVFNFFSDAAKLLDEKVKERFKDEKVSYFITNQSLDENFKVILIKTDRYPGGYFLYNKQNNTLDLLSEINPLFTFKESEKLVKLDTISFINKNGRVVQGYITVKENNQASPLVILLHRNIRTRNSYRYNNVCQFFANRGYRVYQLNYSGSTGYGKKFRELGDKQIGKNIYDDIISGYNEVKKRYKIDKSKVIIYGEGVAGCIALQSVTMPDHPFKAVIANSPSLNLFSYIKAVSLYNKKLLPVTYKQIGNPLVDISYLKFASPIFNVQKINVPVLLGFNFSDQTSGTNENMDFIRIMQSEKKEIYFFSTFTNENVHDINTYEVPFFETIDNFLYKK